MKDFSKQINHKAIAFNKIYENYHDALLILLKT